MHFCSLHSKLNAAELWKCQPARSHDRIHPKGSRWAGRWDFLNPTQIFTRLYLAMVVFYSNSSVSLSLSLLFLFGSSHVFSIHRISASTLPSLGRWSPSSLGSRPPQPSSPILHSSVFLLYPKRLSSHSCLVYFRFSNLSLFLFHLIRLVASI